MKKIYLSAILLVLYITGYGQTAAAYNFSSFSSPFTSIAATGTPVAAAFDGDEVTFYNVPIGFSFVFCGSTSTLLSANTNGYISLANYSTTSVFTNSAANIPSAGFLMPWWDDLDGLSGQAYYATTGTAPNRVFTFEWNNWGQYDAFWTGFFGISADNAYFQVKLREGSNIIDFCYGSSTYGSLHTPSATIGIANSTTDFKTLPNSGTSPTPSSATFTSSLSSSPANGQVYRWSPCALTVAPTANTPVCANSTLSLSGTVTGGTATSYSWAGPSGFTAVSQDTAIANITAANAGTYTFTATNASCSVTGTTTVTVTPAPSAAITGTTSFCSGSLGFIHINGTSGATAYYHINSGAESSVTLMGGTANINTGTLTTVGTSTVYTYYLDSVRSGSCMQQYLGSFATVTVNPNPSPIVGAVTSMCAGYGITLSDPDAGGTWTTGNGTIAAVTGSGTTGYVTGVGSGITNINYIFPTGCLASTSVTVNTLPSVSGAGAVCIGSDITLSAVPGSGTWASTTGNATVDASGDVHGVSAGSTNISYTLPVTGCYVVTPITVNPLPDPITGPGEVCQLASITLGEVTTPGGWSATNSNASVTAGGGVVTGAAAGQDTIYYTLPTGCRAGYSITVDPIPAPITGSSAVCEAGSVTTLADATTPGTWSSSNGHATIDASGVVTGVTAGSAIISYTLPVTNCYVTLPLTVNPLPTPITGPAEVCATFSIALASAPGSGTWSTITGNAGSTSTGATGTVTGVSPGPDTAVYTLGTSCKVSYPITIHALPAPIQGANAVCEAGGTTTLTNDSTYGEWTSSDPAKATIDISTGVVTGISAGSITITYALLSTGCFVTMPFTVNPLPSAISGADTLCAGSTEQLGSLPATGTWQGDNDPVATVSSTGLVTGVAMGTVHITYTLGTGCLQQYTVNVRPLPAAITGTTEVCSGLTVTLSDDSTGGTWSSLSGATASVVPATGVVTGNNAGTTTISYTLPTGCYVTTPLLVDPLPSNITGATDVCNGASTTFTDVTVPGTWGSLNTGVATVDASGVVTGAGVGTTTITYALSTGCIASKSITVDPLPAGITGPGQVCVGSAISLGDATGGGTWTSLNLPAATVTSGGLVTGANADTVTIKYTNPLTGCYVTSLITVEPLPAVITGTATVCQYATTTLSDASGTGTWSSQNTGIATVNSSGVVTGVNAGTTNITFSLATGCYVIRAVTVNAAPTAITGTLSVCVNATTTLGDAPSGGTWSIVPLTTAVVSPGGVVTGVSAGTATVDYTVAGCSQTATVTVNPLPGALITPIGDTMMCPGEYVILTANTGAGLSYQWYDGAATIPGATNSYYSTTAQANYKVKVTSSFGCVSTSSLIHVTLNPATAVTTTTGPTTFCANTSLLLNANTGAGLSYQWMLNGVGIPGATSSNYVAGPAGPGDYSVTVSNTTGCSATSSPAITITLLPVPADTLYLSGPQTFCTGDSIVMTADHSAGLTYQWYNGSGSIPGATNYVYTAFTSDIYSVQITNDQPCTSTPSVAVNELPLPSAVISSTGPSIFCTGGSVLLSVPTAATYQWYNDSVLIPGATNSVYIATANGHYTAIVASAAGCTNTTSPAFNVVEIATPVVLPQTPTDFCWGGSVVLGLSIPASTGATFQWQKDGVDITGATSDLYTASTPGDYSCTVSLPTCSTASIAVTVVEHPLPNPVITYDGVTMSTGNYYITYQWYKDLVAISGATAASITPAASGSYEVAVTDTNGCQSVSTAYNLTGSLGVQQTGITGLIKIYPNPATSAVHVQSAQQLKAVICTIDGRRVMELPDASDIDISSLTGGVYTLMLYDRAGLMVKAEKLVKE